MKKETFCINRGYLAILFALTPFAFSCTDDFDYQETKKTTETTSSSKYFNYSTTSNTKVSIHYSDAAFVHFEIYDETPVTEGATRFVKKTGITPLYAGYTDINGDFNEEVTLPSYLTTAYIYTSNNFVQPVLTANVTEGSLTASDKDESAKLKTINTKGRYDYPANTDFYCIAVNDDGWKDYLGEYYKPGGTIKYAYQYDNTGYDFTISEHIGDILRSDIEYIKVNGASSGYDSDYIPQAYACNADVKLKKATEIAITMLGGNSCYTSSLGYYYYTDNEKLNSYEDIKGRTILIFPNTIDGGWERWGTLPDSKIGTPRQTTVQLVYYPDINDKTIKSDTFPEGLNIGFVLATESWTNYLTETTHGYTSSWNPMPRHTTNLATTLKSGAESSNTKATAAIVDTKINDSTTYAIICFEDDCRYKNDGEASANYTDVYFALQSCPDAITTNTVEQTLLEDTCSYGLYCFEDLWPAQGDYDMNDAIIEKSVVTSRCMSFNSKTVTIGEKTFTLCSDTCGPNIYQEKIILKPYKDYAVLDNKIGFRICEATGDLSTAKFCCTFNNDTTKKCVCNFGTICHPYEVCSSKRLIYVGDSCFLIDLRPHELSDIANKDTICTITIQWDNALACNAKTNVDCFIYRTKELTNYPDSLWEVHVPFMRPSACGCKSYFHTQADSTHLDADTINYYTTGNDCNFPFAFYLSNARISETQIIKMLDRSNETKRIDVLFPKFTNWRCSNGRFNKDWYK